MPNYAQAAIQLRQNKERRAKEKGSRRLRKTSEKSDNASSSGHNDSFERQASFLKVRALSVITFALSDDERH